MRLKLGLALGSGGARGLAHVGVLSVLEAAGLAPACIAGTSMGALVGALYAECLDSGEVARRLSVYTDDPEFKESWEPFVEDDQIDRGRSFFHELRRSLQRKILTFKTLSSPSQRSAEILIAPLERLFTVENLEQLRLPFAAIAIDLHSGQPRVFERGRLTSAIYASSAVPGVFPPLELDGQLLVDGGGAYRVPVGVARRLGADFVIAIDLPSFLPEREDYRTGMDVLLRSDAIARLRLNQLVLREADFVVTPDVGAFHWANFAAAERIEAAGVAAMRAALPALRAALAARESRWQRLGRALRRLIR